MKEQQQSTVIIATSFFGNPVSDYYKSLGNEFVKDKFRVVFIFDNQIQQLPKSSQEINFYTWPNKRPTKLSDFLFLCKIIKKENPILCISNFGSTNIMSLASYIFKVKNRVNYIHTPSLALNTDSSESRIKKMILKNRKKYIYKLNTHFLVSSLGVKEDAIDYYKIPSAKINLFPILIKDNSLVYKNKTKRQFCLCIVGRLDPCKGHEKLFYLFKECLVDFPELKLNIIGDGYLKPELKKLLKRLKISSNVCFIGKVPNNKINDIFSNSLINISSSIEEAYGLVNIEALREGTPLISTQHSGALDIIDEGVNGEFMFHDKNESLLIALRRVLNNWSYYSVNSFKIFKTNYSLENISNHHRDLKAIIDLN